MEVPQKDISDTGGVARDRDVDKTYVQEDVQEVAHGEDDQGDPDELEDVGDGLGHGEDQDLPDLSKIIIHRPHGHLRVSSEMLLEPDLDPDPDLQHWCVQI